MSDLFGGGGGGSAPATQTVTQQNAVSAYAAPYVENLLGKAQALTSQPYQAYGGERTADFTGLQNQAFNAASNMGITPQTGQASGLAGIAGLGAMGVAGQQNPFDFQQQVGGYMSPYMQQVLAPQLEEMRRQYGITGTQQQSAATQAGAFGGSREAIMAAENARNLGTAQNQAIGQAYGNAFNAAQNQYNQAAQNRLAGLGAMNTAANTLGQLGQNQYAQQTGNINLQNQLGTQQQQQQQNILNQQYQDFLAQKQQPYNQLSFMQSMLSGLPLASSVQNVYSNPSMLSQVAGLGTTALAGAKLAGYADGGSVGSGIDELGMYNALNT